MQHSPSVLRCNGSKRSLFNDPDIYSNTPSPGIKRSFEEMLLDDDSGLGMEYDMFNQVETPISKKKRHTKRHFKKSLFPEQRLAERPNRNETTESHLKKPNTGSKGESECDIIQVVERLTSESILVADGSRDQSLPTIHSKHGDLNAISPDTMQSVLSGKYDEQFERITIIDCRYPYEYEGGHIKGAVNLYTREAIHDFLNKNDSTFGRHVLIFHCEFSMERGPKMYRFLRAQDREKNKDQYPRLHFPEIYLLEGGYKAFYSQHQDSCFPPSYTPMLHKEHSQDLRHFRVMSKSWAAGEKKRRHRHQRSLGF